MKLFDLMLNKVKWNILFAYFKLTKRKIHLKTYFGKKVHSASEGNEWISQMITSGIPSAVCRLGYNELRVMMECTENQLKGKKIVVSEESKNLICNNAGFFPKNDAAIEKFSDMLKEALGEVDLLGVWDNKMEDLAVKEFMPNVKLCELRGLEPYYFEEPWSANLRGKKVLVIHPFAETIEQQYKKREKLFEKPVLPEFELYTLKAVQTAAGEKDDRFNTWFDALEYMVNEALKIDFDVAIIGCGAYGLPLATKLKKAGKIAIHVGGATQIIFGIKGKRWDVHPVISTLYNDEWVRPSENESPSGIKKVENGCYW